MLPGAMLFVIFMVVMVMPDLGKAKLQVYHIVIL